MFAALYALVVHASPTDGPRPILQVAALPATMPAPSPDPLVRGALDDRFVPTGATYTPNAVEQQRWYRLSTSVDWDAPTPPVLSFSGATYIHITVYAPADYQPQELWFTRAESIPRFSRHHLALELPRLRAGQPVYVKVAADSFTRRIKANLTDLASYQASDLNHVRLTTLFGSVQFTMILAALCLWVLLRDRVLAYFIGYASFQLMYQLLMNGEIYEWPIGKLLAPMGTHAPWLFAALSAPLSLSFIVEFCDLRQITPLAARILGWMRWPFLLAALLLALPFSERMHSVASSYNLWFIVTSLWSFGAVFLAVTRHGRQARFFLIAWMPQVVFTVLRTSQVMLSLDQPLWLEYGLPFTQAFSSIVVTIGLADLSLRARRERDIAHHLADHDALTGVLNRRALVRRLHAAITETRLQKTSLALLFLDMDHFKSINDRYGHQAGDECLRAVAEAMADELRPADWLGRYGGEEFVIVLPGATHDNAMAIGERIRRRIESMHIHSRGNTVQTTVSVGVTCLEGLTDTADELIARADAALYCAKTDGRNRIVAHPPFAATGS